MLGFSESIKEFILSQLVLGFRNLHCLPGVDCNAQLKVKNFLSEAWLPLV